MKGVLLDYFQLAFSSHLSTATAFYKWCEVRSTKQFIHSFTDSFWIFAKVL